MAAASGVRTMKDRLVALETRVDGIDGPNGALDRFNATVERNTNAFNNLSTVVTRLDERMTNAPTREEVAHLDEKAHTPATCPIDARVSSLEQWKWKIAGGFAVLYVLVEKLGIFEHIKKTFGG